MPRDKSKYMGKRGKAKNGEKKDNSWSKENAPYDVVIKENALFDKYYRQLNICETNEEFDEMLSILQKPLPITFRVTGYKSFSKEILAILKEKHFKYLDTLFKENETELVASASKKVSTLLTNSEDMPKNADGKIYECLQWYPDEMAYKVLLSKADIRKNSYFEEFKLFLMHQTENGNLNRQEAVSMLPPLFLDIQSHHKILDMCASPGSKTAQLIEFLHADKSNPTPEGFVIANDLDNKRCYMLMHQLKRLESPNFMIINQDASCLPNLRGADGLNIMYDRILADVPCSGDGTFRKNIDIWAKWNFAHAANLHGIQLRIASRAAELLKPGGLMVYSTCSLNPVENEAVVATLLLKFKDQLELVDSKDKLPTLKSLPGLHKWNLMTKQGDIINKVEEVANDSKLVNLLRPNMFPPEESVAKELCLERCMRILPHYQNSGGFFIAVIRKKVTPEKVVEKKDMNVEENKMVISDDHKPVEADESRQMKAPPAKRVKHVWEENPFKFIDTNEVLMRDWPKIKKFFHIGDDFPADQMMTRNKPGENIRTIYFVSKQIRELVTNNSDRMKFINMGVPLFVRADIKDPSQVELRVSQESLDIVHKFFKFRTVYVQGKEDLIKILTQSTPLVSEFSEQFEQDIKEKTQGLSGSLVIVWKNTDDPNTVPISFTAWLGKVTLRPFLKIDTRRFFLTVLGLDQLEIEAACNKVKLEDEMNSKKSMETNPQSIHYKGPKVIEEKVIEEKIIEEEKMDEEKPVEHVTVATN